MKIVYSAFLVLCYMILLGTTIDFIRYFCCRKETKIVVESIESYGEKGGIKRLPLKGKMDHNDVYIIYR